MNGQVSVAHTRDSLDSTDENALISLLADASYATPCFITSYESIGVEDGTGDASMLDDEINYIRRETQREMGMQGSHSTS